MSQGKNHYSITSINALLSNLLKFHKVKIKRRWCFECLRWLVDNGYIKRSQRFKNDSQGLITQIPSMIVFTLKGIAWLSSKGVVGARKLYKTMVKWLNKKDKRFPVQKDIDGKEGKPEYTEDKVRLSGLLGIVGRKI